MFHSRPSIRLAEITLDCRDPARVGSFWSALFRAPLRVPMDGWFRLGPLTSDGPVLNFQPVPEEKTGKARLHLDLLTDDMTAAVHAVMELGGRDLGDVHHYEDGTVVLMADPEGNEFCLVQHKVDGVLDGPSGGGAGT